MEEKLKIIKAMKKSGAGSLSTKKIAISTYVVETTVVI